MATSQTCPLCPIRACHHPTENHALFQTLSTNSQKALCLSHQELENSPFEPESYSHGAQLPPPSCTKLLQGIHSGEMSLLKHISVWDVRKKILFLPSKLIHFLAVLGDDFGWRKRNGKRTLCFICTQERMQLKSLSLGKWKNRVCFFLGCRSLLEANLLLWKGHKDFHWTLSVVKHF